MPSPTQVAVRDVLRGAGPLSVDEILARIAPRVQLTGKNPKTTVRNVLSNDSLCESAGNGRYVYLPTFVRGARVRLPIDAGPGAQGGLPAGSEVVALLWTAHRGQDGPTPVIALRDGPAVTAVRQRDSMLGDRLAAWGSTTIRLPAEFFAWWRDRQRAGADALLLQCEDGEAGRFSGEAVRTADINGAVRAARNAELRQVTQAVLARVEGMWPTELAPKLLARGVYHADPPPDPLTAILADPEARFCIVRMGQVGYRPEITPALRRLFAHRLESAGDEADTLLRRLLGEPVEKQPAPRKRPSRRRRSARAHRLVRLKVSLESMRLERFHGIWRVIDILDNQTLDDLHHAIRDAFGWDDDHLYAFFLSGRAWDDLTEVARPVDDDFWDEPDPPTADEVTLADLEPEVGQRWLYLFDYGDELRHQVQVVQVLPAPDGGDFPRIVEQHGDAPPQYEAWDGEDG